MCTGIGDFYDERFSYEQILNFYDLNLGYDLQTLNENLEIITRYIETFNLDCYDYFFNIGGLLSTQRKIKYERGILHL